MPQLIACGLQLKESTTSGAVRIVAAIVLACFGGGLIVAAPPFGIGLVCLGLGAALWQGYHLWKKRRDPYDLALLWETSEREAPDPEEEQKVRELAYCHRCGASMPEAYKICPQCGTPLGT